MDTFPLISLAERGVIPDLLTRAGIRALLRQRIREGQADDRAALHTQQRQLVEKMSHGPIALHPAKANEQHYELPPEFFALWLGPRMKYSACYWSSERQDLNQAEEDMLQLTCKHADIENGMEILDLGCGWGSMALWIAEQYPDSRILAVSNSKEQRTYIEQKARSLGQGKVEVTTADMNTFDTPRRFDRVISVEMFEHMRNYPRLLSRIAEWLNPQGRLFIHIFCHHNRAYFFETDGHNDWMARHFFTGGMMPSEGLLRHFQQDLVLANHWRINGHHYARTALSWLQRLDGHREPALDILQSLYPARQSNRWFYRWRLFLLACAELFAYRGGNEWYVAHFLFDKRATRQLAALH